MEYDFVACCSAENCDITILEGSLDEIGIHMPKLDKRYTKDFYWNMMLLLCCSAENCDITILEGSLEYT